MSNTLGRYAPGSHGSASTAIVFQHPTRQPTLYRSVPKASGSPQSLQKLPQLHAAKVFQHHGMFSQRLSENSQRSARVKLDANLHLLAIHLVARRASARYDRCLYPAQPLRGVTREQQYRRIFGRLPGSGPARWSFARQSASEMADRHARVKTWPKSLGRRPSSFVSVSKSTAVDSVATWVLRLSRDGHIGSSPRGLADSGISGDSS